MKRIFLSLIVFSTFTVLAADYDLLITNARIADGSGAPLIDGSVAVKDKRIVAVGKAPGTAEVTIDAKGKVVAPGFIDVHTHSESILKIPMAENYLRMGVTTVVTGNCGGSRVDVAQFFSDLERTNVALNVATLIGHNSVRSRVMGGSFRREPTPAELEKMKKLVERAMKEGAVGLSTGLIYLPGTFAKTDEIIELAKVAAAHGGIHASHIRAETVEIFSALEELIRVAREAKIPTDISHIKLTGPTAWHKASQVLALLDKARAEGLQITHDQYVYTASSTGIAQLIPDKAREGKRADYLARLDNPEEKAKIVAGMKRMRERLGRSDYSYAVISSFGADPSLNGKTIPEAAQLKSGSDSLENQIELIFDIERRGGGSAIFHGMNEDDLQTFLRHPLTMVASDGGPRRLGEDLPHPRSYGNNARVLGRYVRELKVLKLEEAIRKMTSLPAQTFRLENRGELKPGAWADIVVFDEKKVSDPATFDAPHHFAEGFGDVFVNGEAAIKDGKLKGARPGRAVKKGT